MRIPIESLTSRHQVRFPGGDAGAGWLDVTDVRPVLTGIRVRVAGPNHRVTYLVEFGTKVDAQVPDLRVVEPADDDRWFIVVLVTPEGKASGALSRRMPGPAGNWAGTGTPRPPEPFAGPWGLLTEDEATELAAAWNAAPSGGLNIPENAQVVEVFRFDGDPGWPESQA